jgi:hypothetical protein
MTVHSGHEQTIWEGQSQNMTAAATGGRIAPRYRLTTHFLYYETASVTGSQQQQVELLAIGDVDVKQNLIQKSRGLGSVLVHFFRPSGMREIVTLDSISQPHQVRDLINQTVHGVRTMAHQRQHAEQRDLNTHRYESTGPVPMMGAPMNVAPPAPAIPAQPPAPALAAGPASTEEDVFAALEKLGKLRDMGIVTPEEFEAKKKDLLDRI